MKVGEDGKENSNGLEIKKKFFTVSLALTRSKWCCL